ncbi:MAG: response regulator transcription factor [Formosimonas sp.]
MRLLLIEDNESLAEAICLGLTHLGHTIDAVHSAEHGWLSLENEAFDAVLLDINLPKMSGLDLLKKIRARAQSTHQHTVVIMLTARDTTADKIAGLDLGADDYVIKPFDLDELDARLRAVMRRLAGTEVNLLTRGHIQMDIAGRIVKCADELIPLSRKEFNLLQILLEANGRVVTSSTLESKMYAWGEEIASNSIQVHISNLRKKLGKTTIKTLVGIGYCIE